jgi:hypothetical protein
MSCNQCQHLSTERAQQVDGTWRRATVVNAPVDYQASQNDDVVSANPPSPSTTVVITLPLDPVTPHAIRVDAPVSATTVQVAAGQPLIGTSTTPVSSVTVPKGTTRLFVFDASGVWL